jgi:hypothetical protein
MIQIDGTAAIKALEGLSASLKERCITKIATRVGKDVFRRAFELLSGARTDPPGTYPVPVRTGNLRRYLWALFPDVKSGGITGKYDVGPGMAYVGDSADYADTIHSTRPFLTDAADEVLGRAVSIGDEVVANEIRAFGLE